MCLWRASPIRRRSIVAAGLDRLGLLPADDVIERLRGFDSIISWYGTNRPEFRELIAAAGASLPVPAAPCPTAPCHAVDFYNAQAARWRGTPSRFPVIPCPAVPRTFAVIHPFASSRGQARSHGCFRARRRKLARKMPVHWLCGPGRRTAGRSPDRRSVRTGLLAARARAFSSATIPAFRISPPQSERRSSRYSVPPSRASGRPAASA